jgi:ABC-type Fe3+ transport system permease subunit
MTEKDLAKTLLRGEKAIDVQTLTDRILRRDRRRMWLLGIVCVIAWMAVVMLPWATVMPMVAKLGHQELDPATLPTPALQHEHSLALLRVLEQGTIVTFLDSIACMFIAAICTVSLIIFSRRATLRQVNARLADIAEQLRNPDKL